MHPYLRFNLTYIDTQAFIPIPAPLAAREEVSCNTGRLWNSFMKHDTQPTWFTLHLWALYFSEIFRVAFVRSWESEERLKKIVLSAKHSISFNAIYFLHSGHNKLRQYIFSTLTFERLFHYFELRGWCCNRERFSIRFRISWARDPILFKYFFLILRRAKLERENN